MLMFAECFHAWMVVTHFRISMIVFVQHLRYIFLDFICLAFITLCSPWTHSERSWNVFPSWFANCWNIEFTAKDFYLITKIIEEQYFRFVLFSYRESWRANELYDIFFLRDDTIVDHNCWGWLCFQHHTGLLKVLLCSTTDLSNPFCIIFLRLLNKYWLRHFWYALPHWSLKSWILPNKSLHDAELYFFRLF